MYNVIFWGMENCISKECLNSIVFTIHFKSICKLDYFLVKQIIKSRATWESQRVATIENTAVVS